MWEGFAKRVGFKLAVKDHSGQLSHRHQSVCNIVTCTETARPEGSKSETRRVEMGGVLGWGCSCPQQLGRLGSAVSPPPSWVRGDLAI